MPSRVRGKVSDTTILASSQVTSETTETGDRRLPDRPAAYGPIRYGPRHWHVLTWIVVSMYALFAVWANIPNVESVDVKAVLEEQTRSVGLQVYQTSVGSGFPGIYWFSVVQPDATLGPAQVRVRQLVANMILCCLSIACIPLITQRRRRVYLRDIFWLALLIAIPLALGRQFPTFVYIWLTPLLFFAPLGFAPFFIMARILLGPPAARHPSGSAVARLR